MVPLGAYVVHMVCLSSFVSLSLHDLWSIVKLRLIDTSTTVILYIMTTHPCSDNMTHPHNVCLAKTNADAKHTCLIVKNYDSLTERTSCKNFADAKHACLIVKNYDSLTECMSCVIFADAKHACLIIKTMTPQLNVHSANILHDAKCDTPTGSSDRGPLADYDESTKHDYISTDANFASLGDLDLRTYHQSIIISILYGTYQ